MPSFLRPFFSSLAILVAFKAVFVAIFPDAPEDDGFDDLFQKYTRPDGESIAIDVYDTVLGLFMFVIFLAMLWCPWHTWIRGGKDGTFRYSRMVILYVFLTSLAYTSLVMVPHIDMMFKEQIKEDLFILFKRPSLILGLIGMVLVELYGSAPNQWPGHLTSFLLAANVLEAAVLGLKGKDFIPSLMLLITVPFTPMLYIDRDLCILTCNTDFKISRPFYSFFLKSNPFSPKWYFRFYHIGLLCFGFFNKYFTVYGLMYSMTCILPLLVTEVKSMGLPLRGIVSSRFDLYTETFTMLRVAPLWNNCFYAVTMRATWYSYIDSSLGDDDAFSFWIKNLYLRNLVSGVFCIGFCGLLHYRDLQEAGSLKKDK